MEEAVEGVTSPSDLREDREGPRLSGSSQQQGQGLGGHAGSMEGTHAP